MAAAAKKANADEDSRELLIDAIAAETVDAGFANLSVERVTARAGLSPSSFHVHFEGMDTAVSESHRALFNRFVDRLVGACEAQPSWPLKVKVGIGLSLDLAAAAPARARFLMLLDTVATDSALILQGVEARGRLARLLAAGRPVSGRDAALPGVTEEALIAGLAGVVLARLASGEAGQLPALAPELVELTLSPYLGAEAAAAVARRPRPHIADQ